MNVFHDTLSLTAVATTAIEEGDLVGFTDGKVTTDDAPVKGWARNPAAVGEATSVIVLGVVRVRARGAITAGQVVVSAAAGGVAAAGATPVNPIGRALNAAADGAFVHILIR